MTTTTREMETPGKSTLPDGALNDAVRRYVWSYVLWHGKRQAAETFGVSCQTLWRFLERGQVGRSLPRAVLDTVGSSIETLEAARQQLVARPPARKPDAVHRPLPQTLEDALLLLCAAPLTTVKELASFGRVPASTLRDRLQKLAQRGMVDSVPYRMGVLGPHPQCRYFPTEQGIEAAAMAGWDLETFLQEYPLSRQWFRLLADRLDAVAVLYHVATMVADADPHKKPVRVDLYRQGPYDMLITLSGGRSVGLLRQGVHSALGQPALPPENPGKPALEAETDGHPGADLRRSGQPPGRPHLGRVYAAPHCLCSHRGGTPSRRP